MIRRSELQQLGRLFKPHGIKGELQLELDERFEPDELGFLVLDIEGIYVPFFIADARPRGVDWLVRFDDVENETAAAALAMHDVFYPTARLPHNDDDADDDGVYLADMVGYELRDGDTPLGTIEAIDDSTANVIVFVRDAAGRQVIVPFHDELLLDFDVDGRFLSLQLPQGLIDLNN